MRQVFILAAGLSLAAAAAHAQIDPVTGRPYGVQTPGAPGVPRQPDFSRPPPLPGAPSLAPPRLPNTPGLPRQPEVAAAHPFSPAGEAARERKANAMPKGGPFSPEGEARRERAQEKRDKANASPF